jgi:hypothetical protein
MGVTPKNRLNFRLNCDALVADRPRGGARVVPVVGPETLAWSSTVEPDSLEVLQGELAVTSLKW